LQGIAVVWSFDGEVDRSLQVLYLCKNADCTLETVYFSLELGLGEFATGGPAHQIKRVSKKAKTSQGAKASH
jgi:hypothetical protein